MGEITIIIIIQIIHAYTVNTLSKSCTQYNYAVNTLNVCVKRSLTSRGHTHGTQDLLVELTHICLIPPPPPPLPFTLHSIAYLPSPPLVAQPHSVHWTASV